MPSTLKQTIDNNNFETAQLFVINTVPDLDMIPDIDFKRPKTGVVSQLAAVREVSKMRKIRSSNTKDITNKNSNIDKLIRKSMNLHDVEKSTIKAEVVDPSTSDTIRNKLNSNNINYKNHFSNSVGSFFFPFVGTEMGDITI